MSMGDVEIKALVTASMLRLTSTIHKNLLNGTCANGCSGFVTMLGLMDGGEEAN